MQLKRKAKLSTVIWSQYIANLFYEKLAEKLYVPTIFFNLYILKEKRNATNTSSHCKHTIRCKFLVQMIFILRSSMCPSNYSRINVIIDYIIILVCA